MYSPFLDALKKRVVVVVNALTLTTTALTDLDLKGEKQTLTFQMKSFVKYQCCNALVIVSSEMTKIYRQFFLPLVSAGLLALLVDFLSALGLRQSSSWNSSSAFEVFFGWRLPQPH